MDRISVVQACLDRTRRGAYVEIGVEFGVCFARIRAGTKIAVDPCLRIPWWRKRTSERRAAASHYVAAVSDEFFERHAPVLCPAGIDVAFIDGLHTWEQALRDVDNALARLTAGGVIVRPGTSESTLDRAAEAIREMGYEDLRKERKRLLNLKHPDYLHEFLRRGVLAGGAGHREEARG
jgi:hypothetical protein